MLISKLRLKSVIFHGKKTKHSTADSFSKQFRISLFEKRIYSSIFIKQLGNDFSSVNKAIAKLGLRKYCCIIFLRIKCCANFIVHGQWWGKNTKHFSVLANFKIPSLSKELATFQIPLERSSSWGRINTYN